MKENLWSQDWFNRVGDFDVIFLFVVIYDVVSLTKYVFVYLIGVFILERLVNLIYCMFLLSFQV